MTILSELAKTNSSFSPSVPGLQLAVDSHSLGEFKTCPRRYYYSIVLGWQSRELSVHLTFGLLMHEGLERYEREKAAGLEHEAALEIVVAWALEATWNKELSRPWASPDPAKNRTGLLRTLVWYLDKYGPADPIETARWTDGRPAVEVSFRLDSGYETTGGESWQLCGHLDRIGHFNGQAYIVDPKTTGWTIDASWFSKFSPFNQFSLYAFAGQVIWTTPIAGLIVDGIQITPTHCKFERGLVPRSAAVLEEWHVGLGTWLRQMEVCAIAGAKLDSEWKDPSPAWPMNELSCGNYSRADGSRGGCEFRDICSKSPSVRQPWLVGGFVKRAWDPLIVRGEL